MNLKENMKRFGTKNLNEQKNIDIIWNQMKDMDMNSPKFDAALDALSMMPGFDAVIANKIIYDLRRGKFDEDTAKRMLMLVPIVGNFVKIQQIVKVLQD